MNYKGTVTKVESAGEPYQSKYGTLYSFNVTINCSDLPNDKYPDANIRGLYSSKSENQDKFVEGKEAEFEYEENIAKSGKEWVKIKPYSEKGSGGGRTIMQKLTDTTRMCRSNAISAYATINNVYNQEIITKGDIATIEKFTTGDITGDIEKFGPEASLHTSRLSAMNLAALMTTIEGYKNVDELIDKANKLYQYITK